MAICFPTCWADVAKVSGKLGYDLSATDHWRMLGLAMYDGPEPTDVVIAARSKTALQRCDIGVQAGWADMDQLRQAEASVMLATNHVEHELAGVLEERRKMKDR